MKDHWDKGAHLHLCCHWFTEGGQFLITTLESITELVPSKILCPLGTGSTSVCCEGLRSCSPALSHYGKYCAGPRMHFGHCQGACGHTRVWNHWPMLFPTAEPPWNYHAHSACLSTLCLNLLYDSRFLILVVDNYVEGVSLLHSSCCSGMHATWCATLVWHFT